MKPDWKDAPMFANWVAMDSDGQWNWYMYEPVTGDPQGYWHSGGYFETATKQKGWRETLEHRPTKAGE